MIGSSKKIGRYGPRGSGRKFNIDGFRMFSIKNGTSPISPHTSSGGAAVRRLISSSDSFSRFILVEPNLQPGDVEVSLKPMTFTEASSNWSSGLEYTVNLDIAVIRNFSNFSNDQFNAVVTESADCDNQIRSTARTTSLYFKNNFSTVDAFQFQLKVYTEDTPTSRTQCFRNINVGEILVLVRESKILGITQNPFFNQLAITEIFL